MTDQHQRATTVAFGEYVVDLDARTVERDGEPISLEPQVFDVLALLIEHRDRVVSKLELLDTVWGDRFVSPATLTSRIRDLRAALGDSGRSQHVIKTAHGRGFRFVAPLTDPEQATSSGSSGARRALKPLVGRDAEFAELHDRLDAGRLVTLVGPGGVGKTHLMRHATVDLDAIVVELADVRDADTLHRTVLAIAGGTERPDVDTTEALTQLLAGRDSVIVLDNCEHVIDAAIRLISVLLQRCPDLRILATSRRPLRLTEEFVIRIGPLDTGAAIELLVGHAARHGAALDGHDDDIVHICERLDRLPLALELAASKTRALALADLSRLLDDRFSLLTSDARDAADHHRSLDTAIGWSVDLLTESQRRLLTHLSVFVGSFDLATVEAVCAPTDADRTSVVADVVALADLSLVAFDPGTGRYRLLESIRMYAESQGVDEAIHDRFRNQVLATIEAAGALPVTSFSADLAAIRAAWPSVRSVVGRSRERDDATTLHRIVAATTRFAEQTFAFEVLDWIDAAIELDDRAGATTPPSTHLAAALLLTHRSMFDAAARHLPRLNGTDPALAELVRLWHRYFTGDLDGADAAAAVIHDIDGGRGTYAAVVATTVSQFLDKGAQRPFDPDATARLTTWATGNDPAIETGAALCAALRLDWDVDADVAIEQLTTTIDAAQRDGLALLATGASTARSLALAISPAAASSARGLRATLRSYAEVGSWQFALADFGAAALTLVRLGQPGAAAELLGARQAAGYVGDSSNDVAERAAEEARASLGKQRFADALRQGSARDPATGTRLALAALDDVIDD